MKLNLKLPTYVLPNCCDPTLWTKRKRLEDDQLILGWQGSITHDNDIKIAFPALRKLMTKHKNLNLSFTGGIQQETYDTLFKKNFTKLQLERIAVMMGTPSFKGFPEYLSKHQWDIGIIPLRDSKFSRGKSHIKWLENSLIGVPSVASNVYPYAEPIQGTPVIQDGTTGILCKDDQWEDRLGFLIESERQRKYIARDARDFVLENWTYKKHIHKWEEAFASVIKEGSKSLRA